MGLWDSLGGANKVLDDDLFRRICGVIHDRTGLFFGESSRFFFEKRLDNRLEALGGMAPADYMNYLLFDAQAASEWDALLALLTTNETYFMREEKQLRCFQKDILPALRDRKAGQRIRVWSAGCSSGEEPYSIAILVRESGAVPESQVEIFATDINTRVLAKAKEGLYTDNSFRSVDASFKARWFAEEAPGRFRIREDLRRRVQFSRFNLFDLDRYSLLTGFDVIFCRNVIIYFDMEAKAKVMERFWEKMAPGGFLLLGHSESLISITDRFKLIHLPNDLVYTKA
jgi:chemotaxis protein methyltransferase CheR